MRRVGLLLLVSQIAFLSLAAFVPCLCPTASAASAQDCCDDSARLGADCCAPPRDQWASSAPSFEARPALPGVFVSSTVPALSVVPSLPAVYPASALPASARPDVILRI
jgi:hypothetical protein